MSEPSNITASSSNQWGSFLRHILKLVSGTTIAQLLVVLASPLLTRLYGPEVFGLLAFSKDVDCYRAAATWEDVY